MSPRGVTGRLASAGYTDPAVGSAAEQRRVGAYTLLARVDEGGQALAWVAEREGPGGFRQRVLLKELADNADAGKRARFTREVRILATLDSPHIPHLVEYLEEDGARWIAMELVPGCNLFRLTQRMQRLSEDIAVHVGLGVARALATVHASRDAVVHRDVAPKNILISMAGEVKLIDFGLAGARRQRRITEDGDVHGRLHYIAPEYMRTGEDTSQSDMYSLGVVLYRCLAKRFPFEGADSAEVSGKAEAGDFERLVETRPDLDAALCGLVDGLLAADAGRRPSALEVVDALVPLASARAEGKVANWVRGLAPDWAHEPAEAPRPRLPSPPPAPSSLPPARPAGKPHRGPQLGALAFVAAASAAGWWGWTGQRGGVARAVPEQTVSAALPAPVVPVALPPPPAPAAAVPDAGAPAVAEQPPAAATPTPSTGTLVIRRQGGATIYVDGKRRGSEFGSTDVVVTVSAGRHAVRAIGPGTKGTRRVTVVAGRRRVVRFGR